MKISHRDFLPAVLEVQETPPSPLGRIVMWVVMLLLVLSVCWSALSQVDIVAVTRGKLAVSQLSRPVHTAVTAEIAQVLVREGQRVEKGQVLVLLNSASLQAQKEENQLRQRINDLHIARLNILRQRYADVLVADSLPEELLLQDPQLSHPVQAQLKAEIASDRQEKEGYRNSLQILDAQLESYQAQKVMAEALLPIYQQQYNALEKLYKNKMTSNDSLLETRKNLLEANYTANSTKAKVREARANHRQKGIELDSYMAEKISKVEQERVERLNENALLASQLKQQEAILRQYTLTAPVSGRVESLAFRDAGAAVEAPQEVLKIVPEGEKLNAEVLIGNQDIGFLQLGQKVTVKIDTFDFTRYGWVEGTLVHLAADAMEDQELGLVYKGVIELSQNDLLVNNVSRQLEPGMTVSAEIKTGRRTVLSYLLSPMLEALDDVGKQR